MKISKQNKKLNKKIITLLCIVAGLLLVAAAVYLVAFKGTLLGWQPFGSNDESTQPVTQSSSDTNHGTKEDTTPGTDKTTDQIPVSDTLEASIDELGQSGGYVTLVGSVTNAKTSGSCSVAFTNPNDRPITRTVNATLTGDKAICETVKIPETEFSFLGEWTATLRYYSNDTQAVAERKITIQ